MATLSFLMGFACLAPFRKKGGCQIHSAVTYMMAGLLVLNVYAEYFSLFAGVGFWASLIAVFAAVIGGMLTFKNAKKLKEAAAELPIERILLETDCPYLAPEPYRGKRNSSLYLPQVVAALAELKGLTCQEIEDITWHNGCRFYGLE